MKIQFEKLMRTCMACPSQWDGITDDGRAVYIRFRHSELTVSVADSPDDVGEFAAHKNLILDVEHDGDGHDGCMTEETLRSLLAFHDLVAADVPLPAESLTSKDFSEMWSTVHAKLWGGT